MPPFLMLIGVAFVLLMVVFGNNPVDQWKEDARKYGKEPLARDIKKFNEEREKEGAVAYRPPPGSTLYRIPQASVPRSRNAYRLPGEEDVVHPAPEIPISEWDNPYPSYMYVPPGDTTGVSKGRPNANRMMQPGQLPNRN